MRRTSRRTSRPTSQRTRARRNTSVQISAEFMDAANRVVYTMLERSLRDRSIWRDLDEGVRQDLARNAVLRMVEYLLDPTQAPRMNNEPIPSPAKVRGEQSPFANQIRDIMNDGRYRSTQVDRDTGVAYTYPIVAGTRTYTFTLWKEALQEFNDLVLGIDSQLLSYSGGDDLFSEDTMNIAKQVEEARQKEKSESDEDLFVSDIEGPRYIEVIAQQEVEDTYSQFVEGLFTTWLSGDYPISTKELNWFRREMKRPNLTEKELRQERLMMAKAMILHGDRMNFLQKDPVEWTKDEQMIFNYLKRALGPKKIISSTGNEMTNPNWSWYFGLKRISKHEIPARMVADVLSWHISPLARRKSHPYKRVNVVQAKKYSIPTPTFDLHLAGYHRLHGIPVTGEACPSCKRIQNLIGVSQANFDELLRRFYLEGEWIRQQD